MRDRTRRNRSLGISAGRERRSATGNRDVASEQRRPHVFRQDVTHLGVEHEGRPPSIAQLTPLIVAARQADPGRPQLSIAIELGTLQNTVSKVLREVRDGKRDPVTGELIRQGG